MAAINNSRPKDWFCSVIAALCFIYRLITAYLLLRVNLDKIMHAH